MKPMKSIALALSSLLIMPTLAYSKELNPTQTGLAMMRLQASVFSLPNQNVQGGSIWSRLRGNFRLNEVNANLVRSHEYKFATNSAYFNRTINRSIPFMYHITQEVQKRGMPSEIALLPFIESAYVTKARSHVGASGLWQFMPATGRHYGLEQTPLYDGRHDVYAATDAALNYLQYLHGLFGDWSLALAAYNWGEGNVSRAIVRAQQQGLPPTYENLKMPAETRNYVPKLLAVRNLVNNPQAFGLKLPEIANSPYFKEVQVKDPMDIMAAAFLANIPEDEFLTLNPAFKTPVFIPKGSSRRMLLPVSAVKTFESNYKEADVKTLLSWDVFTPNSRMDLSTLALQTGSSVSELKRLNGISGNSIAAGRTILLNKNTAAALNQPFSGSLNDFAKVDFDPVPDTFVEQAPVLSQQEASLAIVQAAAQQQQTSHPVQGIQAANANVTPKVNFIAPSTDTQPSVVALAQTKAIAKNAAKEAEKQADIVPFVAQNDAVKVNPNSVVPEVIKSDTISIQPELSHTESTITDSPVLDKKEDETPNREVNDGVSTAHAMARSNASEDLMDWVQASQERKDFAAKAVRDSLAQSEAAEVKARAQMQAREAAETKRQVQLAAEEKAKAQAANKAKTDKNKNTKTTQTAKKSVTYEVDSGDTLYSIAKKHNMDVADLIAANGLKKGSSIKPGQVLKVVAVAKNTKSNVKEDKKTQSKDKKATKSISYTVRKGDTLESIANRYKLKVNDLKRLNKGSSTLKPGQTLKLNAS